MQPQLRDRVGAHPAIPLLRRGAEGWGAVMERADAEHVHPERGLAAGKTADGGQTRAPRGPGPGLPCVPALCEPPGGSGEDHPRGDRANPCSRCDPGFLFEAERWRPDKHGWSARSCLQGRWLAASGECPGALQALGPGFQHPVVRFSPTPVWALPFCSAGPTALSTGAGSEVRPSSPRERSPVGEAGSYGGKVK